MSRPVINERYSSRERGALKLSTFPPHIFAGATDYQLSVGPFHLHFSGRAHGGRASNTVIYLGRRVTLVIPRGFDRGSYGERTWAPYISIEEDEDA